jgi:hypothetical protein
VALKLGLSFAKGSFCFIAILISVFAAKLRAQTSGEIDTYPFSRSVPPVSLCGQFADECSLNSTAAAQNVSNLDQAGGGIPWAVR